MQTNEIVVPHSHEAEQSVLGGLLQYCGAIDRMGELNESDFFSDQHRMIYRAIRCQAEAGKNWDVITVCEFLDGHKFLDRAGGFAYVGGLAHNVPGSANIRHYAEIVRTHATRREIMAAANEMSEIASSKGSVEDAMNKMQARLMAKRRRGGR